MATRAPSVLKFESLSISAGLPPVVDKDAHLSGYGAQEKIEFEEEKNQN